MLFRTNQLQTFEKMSQSSDAPAASSPSAEHQEEMGVSIEQITNVNVASSEFLAAEVLGSADSDREETSIAEDIEMTLFIKMRVKTTTGEKRIGNETDEKTTEYKKTFKRKFNSDKDVTGRVSVSRLRPSASEFKSYSSIQKTSHGKHHVKSSARPRPPSLGRHSCKSYLNQVTHATEQTQTSPVFQSPDLDTMQLPIAEERYGIVQDCRSEAISVISQTLVLQGGQGPFFLPSPTAASSKTLDILSDPSVFSLPTEEEPVYGICKAMADYVCGPASRPHSIDQHSGCVAVRPACLDPSTIQVTPRPALNSQNLEALQLSLAPSIGQNEGDDSFLCHSRSSSVSYIAPQQFLAPEILQGVGMAQAEVAFSTPTVNTALVRPAPISPNGRSSTPPPLATSILLHSVPPTAPTRSSTRHPLPGLPISPSDKTPIMTRSDPLITPSKSPARHPLLDLPTPSSSEYPISTNSVPLATPTTSSAQHPLLDLVTPPSTPTLGSTAVFSNLLPQRKPRKPNVSTPPAGPLKAQPVRRQNPFLDFVLIDGNDSPEKYYKVYPIMNAYRQHQLDINPESRHIGPYRRAAVWEFMGHTFEKSNRMDKRKGAKHRQRARVQASASGILPTSGSSSLARYVMTVEREQHEMEVLQEWGNWMNDEDDW